MFKVDDRVRIVGMPENEELSHVTGSIVGTAWSLGPTELKGYTGYIVLLDVPHSNGNKAVVMTDACIETE